MCNFLPVMMLVNVDRNGRIPMHTKCCVPNAKKKYLLFSVLLIAEKQWLNGIWNCQSVVGTLLYRDSLPFAKLQSITLVYMWFTVPYILTSKEQSAKINCVMMSSMLLMGFFQSSSKLLNEYTTTSCILF